MLCFKLLFRSGYSAQLHFHLVLQFFSTFSDKTGKYWGITTLGYCLNTAVVPLLALAGRWEVAAIPVFLLVARQAHQSRNI